jgi:hypothetical protein
VRNLQPGCAPILRPGWPADAWQGLEGREAVTVIVDDSHSVWAQHRRNLVVVERYVFFPSSRMQLGISRPSLLEANRSGPCCVSVVCLMYSLVYLAFGGSSTSCYCSWCRCCLFVVH